MRAQDVTSALLDLLRAPDREPQPYLTAHLPAHLAETDLWSRVAEDPGLVDLLDPAAVGGEVRREGVWASDLPPVIRALAVAWQDHEGLDAGHRALVRSLWAARFGHEQSGLPGGLRWASLRRVSIHIRLTGHTDVVFGCCLVPLEGGGTLLATTSWDGTVRLWDPPPPPPTGRSGSGTRSPAPPTGNPSPATPTG